uniref:Spermidine/putrescine ABC transporter substrate-binding protein n=1 Tax=Caldiarchaeum subterraneum TaxID=311458 RepID=A0A7C5U4J0_CALS0
MTDVSRRSFFRAVGSVVAAGIAGIAGGYVLGSSMTRAEFERLYGPGATQAGNEIIRRLEAEIKELKEKLAQYEIKDKEVGVYFWAETIPEHLITFFEEKTGVSVIFDTFDSSDEVYAKLFTGRMPYDVTSVTMGGMTRQEHERYLMKLDLSRIPNFKRYAFDGFIKEILNPPFDPRRDYSVPAELGTTGVSFRTDKISENDWPTGFRDSLFDFDGFLRKYSPRDGVKRATMIPGGVETIPVVIKAIMGKSINAITPENVQEAKEILIQQKSYLATYAGASEYVPGLAEARFWVSETWIWQDSPNNVDYVAPVEGSEIWEDSFVIPKSAEHVDAAYAFINYMLEPPVQVAHVLYNSLVTPNRLAYEMLPDDVKNDPSIYPPKEIIDRYEMWVNRTPEEKELLTRAWLEVLAA